MSRIGTKLPIRNVRSTAAFGGRADGSTDCRTVTIYEYALYQYQRAFDQRARAALRLASRVDARAASLRPRARPPRRPILRRKLRLYLTFISKSVASLRIGPSRASSLFSQKLLSRAIFS